MRYLRLHPLLDEWTDTDAGYVHGMRINPLLLKEDKLVKLRSLCFVL